MNQRGPEPPAVRFRAALAGRGLAALAVALLAPGPGVAAPLPIVRAQGGADPGATPPATGEAWRVVDGIAAAVDGRAITWSEIDREVAKLRARMDDPRQADARELQTYVEGTILRELLMAQMGENMGFEDVEARAQYWLDSQTEERGVARMAEFIAAEGFDSQALEHETREQILALLARRSLTGEDAGARGRPWRDRFVAPGELEAVYRRNKADLGAPPEIALQVLDVDARAAGGVAAALELAERLRAEAAAGRDFGELVEEYGFGPSVAERGLLPAAPADAITDAALRVWALRAQPGEVSPPLQIAARSPGDGAGGYRLFRLVDRRGGAPPPPFEDLGLQEFLRREVVAQREVTWLERASQAELAGSWRWPETLR
jgi:hypothetical protein